MGFTKTSEGRVFFQSTGPSANDDMGPEETESNTASEDIMQEDIISGDVTPGDRPEPQFETIEDMAAQAFSAGTQIQIIGLLKALNQRLSDAQSEREEMHEALARTREQIEALQTRPYEVGEVESSDINEGKEATALAEEALEDLAETRRLLLELENKSAHTSAQLHALQNTVDEERTQTHARAEQLSEGQELLQRQIKSTEGQSEEGYQTLQQKVEASEAKLSDALSKQARLERKLDKVGEDRARFIRKMERIEETVLQTRDALNAKAMVLLTDQSSAVAAIERLDRPQERKVLPGPVAQQDEAQLDLPVWQRSFRLHGPALLGLFVAGVLAGWAISEFRAVRDAPQDIQSSASISDTPEWRIQRDTSSFNDSTADSLAAVEPGNSLPNVPALSAQEEAALVQSLEGDLQDLTAKVASVPPPVPELDDPAPVSEIEPLPPEAAPKPGDTPEIADARQANALRVNFPPDKELPALIQKIETQAYNGRAEAQHDLAAIYTAGHGGVEQNYERAAFWFEQAAGQDISNAAYNLGVLHHQGLGLEKDLDQAVRWYQKAATLGHPEAQYNLGIAYIEGIGVNYDPVRAAGFFGAAAAQNIMEAAYNLGLIYENGLLGDARPDEALVWYKRAADQGSPEAKTALRQLARTLGITLDDVNEIVGNVEEQTKPLAPPVPPEGAQSQELVRNIQEGLMARGLYPGPADGVEGPLTKDAIRAYQEVHGLEANGKAQDSLFEHMSRNAQNTTKDQDTPASAE